MAHYYLTRDDVGYQYQKIYYFDNNSTTLIYDNSVLSKIMTWISCGNPSNTLHDFGMMANDQLQICHHRVAKELLVKSCEIYFTSGATESNNMIIQGLVRYHRKKNPLEILTVISSSFEHPSVINLLEHLESDDSNLRVVYLKPSNDNHSVRYGCI